MNERIIQDDIIKTYVAAFSPVDLSYWFVVFICTLFYIAESTFQARQLPIRFKLIYFSGSHLQQGVLIFFAYNNDALQRLDEPQA